MIFTLFYMYSTFVQWWRLGSLRNKINGTLNGKNALMICCSSFISDPKSQRALENLLFQRADRMGCIVVPRQKISLNQWVNFPKDMAFLPIYFGYGRLNLDAPKIYVMVQALLDKYTPHEAEFIEIENFGEPVAWRVGSNFEVILETDLEHLTKLVHCYFNGDIDINHDLKLLRMETVDVEGKAFNIKYEHVFPVEQRLKYSYAEVHWRNFVTTIKELYNKIYDLSSNPKITIENDVKIEDTSKKVPVSEVKPIKKESKKDLETEEERNTLAVHSRKTEHRSPKNERHRAAADRNKDSKTESRKATKETHRPKDRVKDDKLQDAGKINKHRDPRFISKFEDHTPQRSAKYESSKSKASAAVKEQNKEDKLQVKTVETKTKSSEKTKAQISPRRKEIVKTESVFPHEMSVITDLGNVQVSHEVKDNDEIFEDCCSSTPSKKSGSQSTDTVTDLFMDAVASQASGTLSLSKSIDSEYYFCYSDEASLVDDLTLPRQSIAQTNLRKEELESLERVAASPWKQPKKKDTFKVSNIIQEKNVVFPNSKLKNRKWWKTDRLQSTKPPNVLVYADSVVAKENIKEVLNAVLNNEKYTIYDLPVNKSTTFWDESTTLVVVCGNVTPTLTTELLQYLLTGGQLLCLCSDLLYSVLQTFSTAEVREHELVRFSYGDWKRVKMMHHIFCYQASPAKKQFSKDSDQSNHSDGSSPVAPRTPSAVEIQHNGKNYVIQVQVLGTEETWQTPSLLLASVKNSEGRAIFSQVHLEIDPTQYQDDESKYAALTDSNNARLEILKHILSNRLDMDCRNSREEITYTSGYFLGRHDMKLKVLNECKSITNNKLENDKISLIFCGKDIDPGNASSTRLPVLVLSCPSNFSTVQYFETLQTEEIGRLVIYTDVLTSSQYILSQKLYHGIVVIPRRQTQGFGRSSNLWLSPQGCAMFSLQLHVPMKSSLGKFLPLTQHLVMVSIVSAIRSLPGYEGIELGLKWPNDLYAYSKIKIGGLVVASQVLTDVAIVNIGCGINLDNSNPTTCINDIIKKYNEDYKCDLQRIPYEKFFAVVFNELERILKIVQNGDVDFLFDLYYKYWLHSDSEISVMTKEGHIRKVKIIGIDDFGYLTVRSPDGNISGVQPDGNTFDMLKGLIAPKIN